jgi:hypothetical protein
MFRLALFAVFLTVLTGCQYPFEFRSEEEIKEEVLCADPSFADILGEKVSVDTKTEGLRNEYDEKSQIITSKIVAFKKDLEYLRKSTSQKIQELNSQLDPYREELSHRISELVTELKLKESSLAATKKMITRLDKMVEESDTSENLSRESTKWQGKIESLKVQAQELTEAIASLRENIRLNRLKLRLLR